MSLITFVFLSLTKISTEVSQGIIHEKRVVKARAFVLRLPASSIQQLISNPVPGDIIQPNEGSPPFKQRDILRKKDQQTKPVENLFYCSA